MKRRLAPLFFVVAIVAAACAGTQGAAQRPIGIVKFTLPPRSEGCAGVTRLGSGALRIPATVSSFSSQVAAIVNVCIDGQGPFPFIVDTGSDNTIMSAALAKRLALAPVGKPQDISGAGCAITSQDRRINSWSVAGIPLQAQTITAATIPAFDGTGEPDGSLGADVLSRFGAVRIDFRRGSLTVPGPEGPEATVEILKPTAAQVPQSLLEGTPNAVVPMKVESSEGTTTLQLQVRFGSRAEVPFTPDTGASQSVVDSQAAKEYALARVARLVQQQTVCSSVTIHQVSSGAWSAGGSSLHGQTLGTLSIVLKTGVDGLFGADQMSRFGSVVFDFAGGRLVLGAG